MWWIGRNKYKKSSRELEMSAVDRFNPETDLTLEAILTSDKELEKTHIKEFESENKLKGELLLDAYYNDFGKVADPNFIKKIIKKAGYNPDTKKFFSESAYLGDKDDFKRILEADAKEAYEIASKCVKTAAVMKACQPLHLENKRDFKKHGMYNAHRSVSKALKAFEDEDIGLKRKEKAQLRRAVNDLDAWLGKWFHNDVWLGQFFNGQKIDEDKSHFGKGFFDMPHLIEGCWLVEKKYRDKLKAEAYEAYSKAIDNINSYVRKCNADTKGTILRLMSLLPETKYATKLRKKILKKDAQSFDTYLSWLNKKELKNNCYVIDAHLQNLVEREKVSRTDFELMYQSGKLLRCLSSYANHTKKLKKLEKDSVEEAYYKIAKQDQLEKAIDAAGTLERYAQLAPRKYAKVAPVIEKNMNAVKSILENVYEQVYKKEEITEPQPALEQVDVARPAVPLEYAVANAA